MRSSFEPFERINRPTSARHNSIRVETLPITWLYFGSALTRGLWITQKISSNSSSLNYRHARIRRCGLTLIEVLTVTAILAILASVSLLAIMSSRSGSRDLICRNNLRQISLATMQFSDATKQFPFVPPRSGFVELLPYLGYAAHYEQIKTEGNASDLDHPPAVFACPSDSQNSAESVFGRVSNYLPCGGRASYGQRRESTGFAWSRTFADVQDGLSHTVFYSERLSVQNSPTYDQQVKLGGITVQQFVTNEAEFEAACWENYQTRDPTFLQSGYSATLLTSWHPFGTRYPPNTVTCFFVPGRAPPELISNHEIFSANANSFHPGTVNTVFGDGSVQTIGDDISPLLWTAFGTISNQD